MLYTQTNNTSNISTNTTTVAHAHSLLQQFLLAHPHVTARLNDNADEFEFTFTPKNNTTLFVSDCMCNVPVEHIILTKTHVTTKTIWHDGTDYISTLPVEDYGMHNGITGCQILVDVKA